MSLLNTRHNILAYLHNCILALWTVVGGRVDYHGWTEVCYVWSELDWSDCLGQSGIWASPNGELCWINGKFSSPRWGCSKKGCKTIQLILKSNKTKHCCKLSNTIQIMALILLFIKKSEVRKKQEENPRTQLCSLFRYMILSSIWTSLPFLLPNGIS